MRTSLRANNEDRRNCERPGPDSNRTDGQHEGVQTAIRTEATLARKQQYE